MFTYSLEIILFRDKNVLIINPKIIFGGKNPNLVQLHFNLQTKLLLYGGGIKNCLKFKTLLHPSNRTCSINYFSSLMSLLLANSFNQKQVKFQFSNLVYKIWIKSFAAILIKSI